MDAEVTRLMADYDVSAKKGIFAYLLTGEEKFLSIRKFDERTKKSVYVQQKKKCALCGKNIRWEEAEADHITPWSKGGKTVIENCQILCKKCNRKKSGK